MPEVNIYHPCITRISYRQEKGDSDYGTCLWADFEFDTINYRLQIMSDCGNYSYQWVPTPGKESFFGLCRRFDPGYLLSKLSRESEINIKATAKNIVEYIYWNMDYSSCLEDGWEELLEIELSDCETDAEIEDYIKELAKKRNVDIGHYEAWECIEKDYPAGAKRIVKIFETYIKPKIPKGEQP